MKRHKLLFVVMGLLAIANGCHIWIENPIASDDRAPSAPLWGNVYGYGHPRQVSDEPLYKTGYRSGFAAGRYAPEPVEPNEPGCCDATKKQPLWQY